MTCKRGNASCLRRIFRRIERAGGIVALLGAVMWMCLWFARANKRYFSPIEKRHAIPGMLAIDIALQTLTTAALLSGRPGGLPLVAILFGVLFVAVLHAPFICYFVGLFGKQLAKKLEVNGG